MAQLWAKYRVEDYYQRMELRDFIKTFIQKLAEQLGNLRDYIYNFTTYLAKAIAIGNLTKQKQGW